MYRTESRVEHGSIHAFPLKKGEGMRKGRMFFIDTQTRKISLLGNLTGLPKIAAKRDLWEEEEPPCKSSILPFGKMLAA